MKRGLRRKGGYFVTCTAPQLQTEQVVDSIRQSSFESNVKSYTTIKRFINLVKLVYNSFKQSITIDFISSPH